MGERTFEPDPAQDLWLCWRRGERPVVAEFLAGYGDLEPSRLAAVLRVDQRERWRVGERVPVAGYLRQFPTIPDDPEAAVELIYGEFLLSKELGEAPALEDYQRDHPDFAARLAIQVELLRALEDQDDENAAGDSDGGQTLCGDPDADLEPFPEGVLPAPEGYEILEVTGRGGMGVVYKARDTGLRRIVALKFLPAEAARDPGALARFRREARAASALNHPAVCTLHGIGEDRGRPFLVLEWIEGQTLRALAGPHPDLPRLLPLVWQVAMALRAAHAAGIVHRDIKPENVMVRADGFVKVLDFGLVRLLPAPAGSGTAPGEGITDPGMLLGTARYMSPEQARAEPVDAATDIFSLGLVLYELATGRHPFPAAASLDTMYAIANEPPLPPRRLNPEIPEALEALLLRMLEKDPGRRPTAGDVAEVLGEQTAGAGGGAKPATAETATVTRPTVGRDRERGALRAGFAAAAEGRGLLLCVTGEPGLGKTTLVDDFLAELAAADQPHGLARGRCSERLAGTEAYLPFLEALDSLLQGTGGAAAAQVMKVVAPTWYVQLAPLAAEDPTLAHVLKEAKGASQERRKRELGMFLEEVSRRRPLVMFLDDVHWADPSSVDLLAYLGSKCAALRLLLVLTYRPSDLLRSQHPFGPVKLELQGQGICREIALPFLSRDDFDRYLALAFPGHQLTGDVVAVLHARTEGNPLFMVDLLRYLRDRGVIVQDNGRWALGRTVPDLQRELPESVRGMIQRKVDQLSTADRHLLMAASVQGPEFDSAVVAELLGREPADVEERLDILGRVHYLVRMIREQAFPDGALTVRYGFVHVLYQNALYAALQPTRKAAWSAAAAQALVSHHGEKSAGLAAELAMLFEAARNHERATDHYLAAAENAARIFAHHEAVALARRGLALIETLPDTPERARRELPLQVTLGMQLQIAQGFAAPEVERIYARAHEICEHMQEAPRLFPVLWGLWMFYEVRGKLGESRQLAERLFTLAQGAQDAAQLVQARQALAITSLCLGDPAATREHMEQGVALYDHKRHRSHTYVYGQEPRVGCLSFGAVALWLLGYPDQAVERSQQAVALAGESGQPSSLALALFFAALLRQYRRERPGVQRSAKAMTAIATEHGFSFWLANGLVIGGWAQAEQGAWGEAIAQVRRGLTDLVATGAGTYRTYTLSLLAEVLGRAGQVEEGLSVLAEALTLNNSTGERFHGAELYRLQGEFLLRQESAERASLEAEACFRRALAIAREQQARSLELRAAMSLARLCQKQGRPAEAWPLLAESYDWFTEGFDTPDLREARTLLELVP